MRPVLVARDAERVSIQELVQGPGQALAVRFDQPYRYLGDVTVEKVKGNDGTTVKRWFAWTKLDTNLGPFPDRVKAIAALLAHHGMREAKVSETTEPLFTD